MLGPDDIEIRTVEETEVFGRFSIEPLNTGYGYTLGNALRRVLLSSLPGAALTEVRIAGVPHQFTTVAGVKEDVVQLTLNFKKVRLGIEDDESVALRLEAKGVGEVKAGDLSCPSGVEIVNPELVLAHLTSKNAKLEADLLAESGYGYVPAEERESEKIGVIALDSVFTPVLKVSYRVEKTRVGRLSNLDRLVIEIETDGTISPGEAFFAASEILMKYFYRLAQGELKEEEAIKEKAPKMSGEDKALPLEDLELPTRVTNSLRKGGIVTCGELVGIILEKGFTALTEMPNVGEKSIKDVRQKVTERGWLKE